MKRVRRPWVIGILSATVVLGVAGIFVYTVSGGSTPAEVSLSSPASPAAQASAAFDGDFAGTWTVDTTSGSFDDFSDSWAGYRIREELGGVGAHTAVGRTPNVSGSLTVSGQTISAVSITVDMTTLHSDDGRRDNAIRMRGLETDAFPTATFSLTDPIDIGKTPQAGETFTMNAVGDLTLHGVTRQVTVPIQGRWTGDRIEVAAGVDVSLADYAIQPPTGFLVLSIADQGTIEMHLLFEKS